ncbi:MAG: hypothetical protein NXI18_10765 [Alphaproteobacteria bacterium]|nr:hypothetical protein [Alphaproteobacteria bacterium]
MTTTHRYERSALIADYARGGVGLAVTGLPLVATPLATTITVIFGGLATLFAVYVFRTWLRSAQAIEVDADGIRRRGPLSVDIAWEQLDSLSLRYFSTRRDRAGGWMEMKVTGGGRKVAVESSIDDFETVVRHCMLVARRNELDLSETTLDNLRALGLLPPISDAGGGDGPPSGGPSSGGPKQPPELDNGPKLVRGLRWRVGPDRDGR